MLCSAEVGEQDGLTSTAITGATSATTIRYHLHIDNLFIAAACSVGQLTLYFKRYVCAAMTAGSGVASATVSDVEPWDGDNVTFTATLATGAAFDGWYSDAACTQLVSTKLSYTAAAADLTLYAKATLPAGTGTYIKMDGKQSEAKAVYRKQSGVWMLQDDGGKSALGNGKFKVVKT